MATEKEIAVVVGAGGAIGEYIVADLVEAGLKVVGVGRDATRMNDLVERYGDDFKVCIADIGEDSAIEDIRASLDSTVAVVVHAAGVPVAGGVRDAPTSAIVNACNIKVGGFVRLVRAVEPRLRKHSRLVAIGGHYGFEPSPYAATAGVANAALANLVRQMSWAYGASGVTSHLLAPGPADTDRMRKVAETRAAQAGTTVEEQLAAVRGESAIGAMTEPGQVAYAVRMLLDPRADALAGSSIMLDSGRRRGIP